MSQSEWLGFIHSMPEDERSQFRTKERIMPPERNITPCRGCGAPMWWLKMATGSTMPVDAEPSPRGNILVNADGLGVVAKKGVVLDPEVDGPLYLSHYATCPEAGKFRKKK